MYKLLVVDDEYESRTTLCSCFPWQEIGFNIVAQADNGRDALEFIQEHPVDVVLCDIKMPGVSGIEVAKELYKLNSKPIIVFLSGYRDFEYAQSALAYGVRYYMVKPARYEDLMDVFQSLKRELDNKHTHIKSWMPDNTAGKTPDTSNMQEKLINTVKKYMEENFRDANLEDASKLIHMNASYLSQLFKQRTGINFSDYLIAIKMKKAAELLMDPTLKAYDISEMVGYTNAKNFTRTFKNYYGVNPREFRNANYDHSINYE